MKEATIQKISAIEKHTNADALEIAKVLGWNVIVKKGEYVAGDICVYVVIDSVLPEKPEFEFLRNKHFRIKPIRLRGVESAGICFPVNIVPGYVAKTANKDEFFRSWKEEDGGEKRMVYEVGDDVSELIGVKHYEKPIPAQLAGQAVGHFPSFLIITDEDNLRTYPDAVPELYSRPYYITRKDDGSSGTFFMRGTEFGVCSRRIHLKETEGNGFWKMAHKYDIQNAITKAFPDRDIALQGEVVGPGIQHNKLGLTELEFHLFNIFDIKARLFLDYDTLVNFTTDYNIPFVTVIESGTAYSHTLEELIALANAQTYPTGGPAEGIVIRPKEAFTSMIVKKSWSGKIINENYKE
jgi:RNA ligase (TIGR02306 family)